MRTLFLDCGMGAAGDMLTAALIELLPEPDAFLCELNALGIPGVHFQLEASTKCGITGSHISVLVHGQEESSKHLDYEHHHPHHEHEHSHDHPEHGHSHDHPEHGHEYEHEHGHDHSHGPQVHEHEQENGDGIGNQSVHTHSASSLQGITHFVEHHLPVSEKTKKDILAVYRLIAEAESDAHGLPVSEIHFHEVGTMDAIADITAVCMLMEKLAPERVVVSPIHVGSGQVKTQHGILPVPAPATAYILRNIPMYGGSIQGELCTPTGAALLRYFASDFGEMPVMKTQAIGYGMGNKDFAAANCVRAFFGETQNDSRNITNAYRENQDMVSEFFCNLDDMTAEAIGFAMEAFFMAGALDVYTMPIGMKKSRPGTLLCVMCAKEKREDMIRMIFKHTTTLGIRERVSRRYLLSRTVEIEETSHGPIRKKVSYGYGVERHKYEYEDLAMVARKENLTFTEVQDLINKGKDHGV